jgi:uncharacterized protein with PIN domain
MLGSLARKLRALGFDTAYYRTGDDKGLIALAASEGRFILTSDRTLSSRGEASGLRVFLLEGRTDGARMAEIAEQAIDKRIRLVRGDSLCSLCNSELETLKAADAKGKVPPSVGRRHRLFFRCVSCGQLYWRGGHWKKLRSLAGRLERKHADVD